MKRLEGDMQQSTKIQKRKGIAARKPDGLECHKMYSRWLSNIKLTFAYAPS